MWGMHNVSPSLPGTLCKPTIIACSGLLFPGYWVFQVAPGHDSCWKTEELIQGRLEQECQRLEPKAAEVGPCQDGLSSKPKWGEGHPITGLLEMGVKMRAF